MAARSMRQARSIEMEKEVSLAEVVVVSTFSLGLFLFLSTPPPMAENAWTIYPLISDSAH